MTVTYSTSAWVWLEVLGESNGPGYTRSDDGLVGRLMQFMQSEKIDWRAQATGGGVFVGRIPVDDEKRVRAWLRAQGARRTRPR